MKKLYPRKSKQKRFKDYYIPSKEMLTSSTIAVDRQIYPLISDVIRSAKESLCLAFFQMTLDEKHLWGLSLSIFSSLKSRKEDGVDVRVILNQKFATGIQNSLNLKTVKLLTAIKVNVTLSETATVLHTKLIIADGEKAVLGSFNMTVTSLCENHEVAVYLRSPLVKQILIPYFEEIWQRSKN